MKDLAERWLYLFKMHEKKFVLYLFEKLEFFVFAPFERRRNEGNIILPELMKFVKWKNFFFHN